MLATFLIGLREGLEATLVVGILVASLNRIGRTDVRGRLLAGVGAAVALAVGIGAILTFGAYALTSQAMELIGGVLSVLTVVMVTWMIFWMQKAARSLKATLEGDMDRALESGSMWGIVAIGFIAVAREGIETTLFLWAQVQSAGQAPAALTGALLGIAVSIPIGSFVTVGMVRINLKAFFTWTGGLLIIVAAGVLAYGAHDLQEAGVLPGLFSTMAPLADDGTVAVGSAGFPFGWAFDVSHIIAPTDPLAAIGQATIGFMPQMSWLQVLAWALYLAIVGTLFVRRARAPRASTAPRDLAGAPTAPEGIV